ncbi:glycosyltransferase family 4 protein [Pleurocapsa sp. PCC 7319]|uniref:glycosyltransferase family 4 protein n=1 Tax=Pleurocapsa sp. PCC 7319 TaxID=118161 RepID=UPI0003600094|nr:glycosyltransferase family 4 protein [Pleurocapsa sp. PCC 7319]
MTKRLGFLAAAPRISTRFDAEMSGPRSRVLGLVKGFESLNWSVLPFIVGDRTPSKWSTKGSGAAISSGYLRTLAVDIVRLGLGIFNSWRSWRELGRQVDWVYEYAATLQCLGWIFQRQGIPWILQVEALLYYEAKTERKALILDGIARKLELWSYRQCDVIACVSATLKEILVQEIGINQDKIVLVPNGVDIEFLNPQLHEPKRLFSGFTVGFVGSLYSWAGLDLLLEAIYELQSEGYLISLVVVGDGEMKQAWEEQSQTLGLEEQVQFVGRVPWQKVPQYIAGCDIGYSGQIQLQMGKMYLSPMKLYEYMSMAKPVIASAFEDARRLVVEEETGFLFRPGDKNALKESLIKALVAKNKLKEMGEQARREIETNHSWTNRVQVLIEKTEHILMNRLCRKN